MPAFDPVRDAVANSPRTPSYPLPSPSPLFSSIPLNTPSSASSPAFPFPPQQSQRRSSASSDAPPTTPDSQQRPAQQRRPTSLSMLLNGPEDLPSKNHRLAPLLNSPGGTELVLPMDQRLPERRPGSSSSTSSQPHPLRSSFGGGNEDTDRPLISTPSPTHPYSPSRPSYPRLPKTESPTLKHATASPKVFTKPKLPYNPRRITPADSVLRPLTETEVATWVSQNPLRNINGPGQRSLAGTKRARDAENETIFNAPPPKKSKDAGLVERHYNARPDVGVDKRQDSPIIGLKSFNNWIKSVLISNFATPALKESTVTAPLPPPPQRGNYRGPSNPRIGKVLDMGCGKGGDLQKWSKARIADYVAVDIAAMSVDQAYHRWQDLQSRAGKDGRFDGFFRPIDAFMNPLTDVVPESKLEKPFDVVSMQFCMHYAFETEFKVKTMLRNVTQWLRPGGIFIGTIPNDQLLMERLDELPPDATDLSWGNNVYSIRFDNRIKRTYGQRYSFFLKDAVDDVPEYVVHWSNFETLAASYGLKLEFKHTFHEIFDENHEAPAFADLLKRMKVVDENGESHMDPDQWEAANVYLGFAFRKV
ncbi:mRNA cap guanine-N7 methyltransferase [Tulasnella sp. 425]|nr:mRNA cap guanine-N7 methyltransferase [Tulasnella sp. 425]